MQIHAPVISVEQLSDELQNPELRVIDCRFDLLAPQAGRAQYLAGHIPGAIYADLDQDLAGPVTSASGRHPLPGIAALQGTLGRFGIDEQTKVVVYDVRSGAIAARAWWLLRWLGHADVALLDGGLDAWQAKGLSLQRGPQEVAAATFLGAPQDGWVVSTAQIERQLGHGMALVDARAANRFTGSEEPIDTVAGHIPGAVNLPFERSLTGDGLWRSPASLRELWAGIPGAGRTAPWAVMCGSGVTACHLAISAELAGLSRPGLYAGSWSEWIRNSARPVATGSA